MAGPSNQGTFDLHRECARLQLEEDEAGGIEVAGEEVADTGKSNVDSRLCLVGRFLTDKVVNFGAMKNTMAALWRPGKGVCIKALSPSLFLFQFFHEVDVRRILEAGPWTFDQHILLIHKLGADEQPQHVPLFYTSFWIQVYNLPLGVQSDRILQCIGNYIGSFIESDENNLSGVWRNYMRLRISLDVRQPLKRRMRLKRSGGEWFWVDFKYERLNVFCFICGLLDHTERNCPTLYDSPGTNLARPYGTWMKAPPRRGMLNSGERWLKSESSRMGADTPENGPKVGVGTQEGEDGTTNFATDGSKRSGKEKMARYGHQGLDVISTDSTCIQVGSNDTARVDLACGMALPNTITTGYDSQLIISDGKRRRSNPGPLIEVGHEAMDYSTPMPYITAPKNGPAVGPANQAHRNQ